MNCSRGAHEGVMATVTVSSAPANPRKMPRAGETSA